MLDKAVRMLNNCNGEMINLCLLGIIIVVVIIGMFQIVDVKDFGGATNKRKENHKHVHDRAVE